MQRTCGKSTTLWIAMEIYRYMCVNITPYAFNCKWIFWHRYFTDYEPNIFGCLHIHVYNYEVNLYAIYIANNFIFVKGGTQVRIIVELAYNNIMPDVLLARSNNMYLEFSATVVDNIFNSLVFFEVYIFLNVLLILEITLTSKMSNQRHCRCYSVR